MVELAAPLFVFFVGLFMVRLFLAACEDARDERRTYHDMNRAAALERARRMPPMPPRPPARGLRVLDALGLLAIAWALGAVALKYWGVV